jgi:hypothetical protein
MMPNGSRPIPSWPLSGACLTAFLPMIGGALKAFPSCCSKRPIRVYAARRLDETIVS